MCDDIVIPESELDLTTFKSTVSPSELTPLLESGPESKEQAMQTKLTISFTPEAVEMVKTLAIALENHVAFQEYLFRVDPLQISEFDRVFEKRLAMLVVTNVRKQDLTFRTYLITKSQVETEVEIFFRLVIQISCDTFPSEEDPRHLFDGYPLHLLATTCSVDYPYAHMIGESVKHLIMMRKSYSHFLPAILYNVLEGNVPLTGHHNSPLMPNELEAIYRYLGSRKSMYVHILLNSLYEVSQQKEIVTKFPMSADDIILLCKSAWVFLLLFGAGQNSMKQIVIPANTPVDSTCSELFTEDLVPMRAGNAMASVTTVVTPLQI
jgi:hypothetical protein